MAEAVMTPRGPYRLRLIVRDGQWSAPLLDGERAFAWQRLDGKVIIRAASEEGVELARFMLALDDDTASFHERFARDRLLGPTARAFVGWRPLRLATVSHAVLRAICGQLIESSRARALERRILRATGTDVASRERLAAFSAAQLRSHGLAAGRAATLLRVCRSIDLERLRDLPGEDVARRLASERGIGPWSIGVIALEGLGRYDLAPIGDLALVKLASALAGRWVETWETAELLEPYKEWQGLASELLLLGWTRGLVPGTDADRARFVRVRSRRAA